MEKILFYVMEGEKMCFNHVMLNADSLLEAGKEVKIILEGKSVKLPKILEDEKNPLYKKLLDSGVIVGVCKACSKVLGVYDFNTMYNYLIQFLDPINNTHTFNVYIDGLVNYCNLE